MSIVFFLLKQLIALNRFMKVYNYGDAFAQWMLGHTNDPMIMYNKVKVTGPCPQVVGLQGQLLEDPRVHLDP